MGVAKPALQMRMSMWDISATDALMISQILAGSMAVVKSSWMMWIMLFSPAGTVSRADLRAVLDCSLRTVAIIVVPGRARSALVRPKPRPLFAPVTTCTLFLLGELMLKERGFLVGNWVSGCMRWVTNCAVLCAFCFVVQSEREEEKAAVDEKDT